MKNHRGKAKWQQLFVLMSLKGQNNDDLLWMVGECNFIFKTTTIIGVIIIEKLHLFLKCLHAIFNYPITTNEKYYQ